MRVYLMYLNIRQYHNHYYQMISSMEKLLLTSFQSLKVY